MNHYKLWIREREQGFGIDLPSHRISAVSRLIVRCCPYGIGNYDYYCNTCRYFICLNAILMRVFAVLFFFALPGLTELFIMSSPCFNHASFSRLRESLNCLTDCVWLQHKDANTRYFSSREICVCSVQMCGEVNLGSCFHDNTKKSIDTFLIHCHE